MSPSPRISPNSLTITDLDPNSSVYGCHQRFRFEVERIADCEVERDEGMFGEGLAGREESAFGCWAESEDVVTRGEGWEAVVLGGIREGEGAAAEENYIWWDCKGEVFWDGVRYLGW